MVWYMPVLLTLGGYDIPLLGGLPLMSVSMRAGSSGDW